MSSVPVTTPDDPATIALDTSQPLQDSPSPPNSMNQLTSNDLPCPEPASTSVFVWGLHVANDFSAILEATFAEVIHWRRNCFTVPLGKAGKEFVAELSKLYLAFASASALESVALKATIVLPILLLQKPQQASKTKDHISCLERRLKLWKDGDLNKLLLECRVIQGRLPKHSPSPRSEENLARRFSNLVFDGKYKAAMDILCNSDKGGVLHLSDHIDPNDLESPTVKDELFKKHPTGQSANTNCIVQSAPLDAHPVIFEAIDATVIRSAALHTTGAAGPSGIDAHGWRRLCTSFKRASNDLCHSLALATKRICTSFVDPVSISPILACRLIALDKNPGVRPIGIGDVARRIIAKAVLTVVRPDIQDASGCLQMCGGQIAGIEAAVHSVRTAFESDDSEAALFVDATNAFNCLNRQAALHNIRRLCPPLSTMLINTYRHPSQLFMDGDILLSQEGTTQGDPLAMSMYALATIPLIRKLTSNSMQAWYADDAAAVGKVTDLRDWWDQLAKEGPDFGLTPSQIQGSTSPLRAGPIWVLRLDPGSLSMNLLSQRSRPGCPMCVILL